MSCPGLQVLCRPVGIVQACRCYAGLQVLCRPVGIVQACRCYAGLQVLCRSACVIQACRCFAGIQGVVQACRVFVMYNELHHMQLHNSKPSIKLTESLLATTYQNISRNK